MAMQTQQLQMEFQQGQTAVLNAQAAESQARAKKYDMDTMLAPQELEIEKIEAITRNLREGDQDDKEFSRRLKIAEIALKEKQTNQGARNVNDAERISTASQPDQRSIQRPVQPVGNFGGQGQGFGGPTQ